MEIEDGLDDFTVNTQIHELRADKGYARNVPDFGMFCPDLRHNLVRGHYFEEVDAFDDCSRQGGPVTVLFLTLFAPGGVGVGGLALEDVVEMVWYGRRAVIPAGIGQR